MFKNIIQFFLLLLSISQVIAQNKYTRLSGTIADKLSHEPIEFATIKLYKSNSTEPAGTVLTDKKGKFTIDSIAAGQYILKCSYIGFGEIQKEITIDANNSSTDIGTIEMEVSGQTLNEVSVTAKKSLLNTSIDRKVYNVAQDILAQSGSVSDILKNVPSVEVDIEGNVSLRGSGEVMVLINGRPSPLMGKNKAEVLQQIPANTIERIEVIVAVTRTCRVLFFITLI